MAFAGVPTVPFLRLSSFTAKTAALCERRQALRHRRNVFRAQLVGMPEGFGQNNIDSNANEILLAELRFSDPARLPALIQNNHEQLDEGFYQLIENKINDSEDMEERETLKALRDAITDVMRQLYEASVSAQADVQPDGDQPVQIASDTSVAEASYDEFINKMANSKDNADPAALKRAVEVSYDRVDLRLLERLNERITSNDSMASALIELRDTITTTMNERISAAMESLKSVLGVSDPITMRKKVDTLARQGKVDDAFILLLQANTEQAEKAGAEQAMKALKLVLDHASLVKDIVLDAEVRLIRSLLRTKDPQARIDMLKESFTPQGSVELMDGSSSTGVQVDGKKFVQALRKLIEDFGNVDESFVLQLSKIGEESEGVARKLFDMEGKDVHDLQEEAFHKRSVSIWDLEKIEMEETAMGQQAAWEGKMGAIPEGFGEDGKLVI